MALVGRKGRDFFMRRGFDVLYEEVGLFQNIKWSHAQAIAQMAIKEFLGPDISSVYLIYNEYRPPLYRMVAKSCCSTPLTRCSGSCKQPLRQTGNMAAALCSGGCIAIVLLPITCSS